MFSLSLASTSQRLNRTNLTKACDTNNEVEFDGTIIEVVTVDSGYGRFLGILLKLKEKQEDINAFLAPVWFLNQQNIQFEQGKNIKIIGSKIIYQKEKLIIARCFNYQKKTLMFAIMRAHRFGQVSISAPDRAKGAVQNS